MNKIYTFLLPILGIASVTCAMDNNNTAGADNIYQGTLITAQNIAQLAPAPQSVVQSFEEFKQQYPTLLSTLTKFEPINFKQNYNNASQALKDANITNLSAHGNFIFALPNNPNLIAQVAGQRSRIYNISANLNGIGNGWNHCFNKWCKNQNLEELKEADATTYQTISRAANYLMIKQELNKMQNPCVNVWPTYVVPVDSTKNHETANDNTHLVLQEKYSPEFIQIKDTDQTQTTANARLLNNEALLQVCKITSAVKLFDIASNLMVNTTNGNAGIKDTEQPNDEPSLTFFHNRTHKLATDYERGSRGKTKAEHDAQMGFQGLVSLSPEISEKVKTFIKDRNNFPQYSEQGYKEILALAQ